jgi:hypothetical protein
LQHALDLAPQAVEIGAFCRNPAAAAGTSVADFTGLGVEDLYIAEYAYQRSMA